jgi:hypothetical protein
VWPENIIVHLSSRIIASTKRLINRVFTSCLLHLLLFYRCCVSVWINNNVGIYLFFFVNFLTVRIFFFFLKNEGCVCVWWFMQSEISNIRSGLSSDVKYVPRSLPAIERRRRCGALTPPRQLLHFLSVFISVHTAHVYGREGLTLQQPYISILSRRIRRRRRNREEIISGSVWPFGSRGVPHHRPSSAIYSAWIQHHIYTFILFFFLFFI